MTGFSKDKIILLSVVVFPLLIAISVFSHIILSNKPHDIPFPEEVKPLKSTSGVFSGANLDLRDFSFTEYARADNSVAKSFVLSGKRLQTKSPKLGIFRLAVGRVVELESPQITFYKDDQPISQIHSKTGAINSLDKGISFFSNVVLTTQDRKRTLLCDKLKWNNEGEYLLAAGECMLIDEGRAIRAQNIKTDNELSNFDALFKNRAESKTITRR